MGRAEAPPPGAAPTAQQGSLRSEKLQPRKAFHPEGSGQLLLPGRGPLWAGGGGRPGSATPASATGPLHLPRQAARSEDLGNAFCSQRRLGGLAPLFLKELRPHACFTHTCSTLSKTRGRRMEAELGCPGGWVPGICADSLATKLRSSVREHRSSQGAGIYLYPPLSHHHLYPKERGR